MNYEDYIGKNIKEVRLAQGLSQQALADKCGFSNTILSQYENSKKIPNLSTTAKIAKALHVTIDRLYYGDENQAFITAETNEGRKIVNAIYHLWIQGVITPYENYMSPYSVGFIERTQEPYGIFLRMTKHSAPIMRLLNSLNDFKNRADTYQNPSAYIEMLLDSVAAEINNGLN